MVTIVATEVRTLLMTGSSREEPSNVTAQRALYLLDDCAIVNALLEKGTERHEGEWADQLKDWGCY